MKIAIVGSRDYPDLQAVVDYVKGLPSDTVIVSGGAGGVDTAAERAAKSVGMATEIFRADWKRFGKVAGFMRNHDIVRAADRVVAFHHKESRGTAHTIKITKEAGKPLEVIKS